MLFFSQFVRPTQRKLVLSYHATNTENWRAFVMLPTQSTGVFSLRLSYCETNKENWRAFFISSIVRTTQNTVFFIWVYIIVRSTQKTGEPFFSMIFILLCYQHKVLTFFYLRLYYCATDTENWCAFLVLIYSIMRPKHKTGMHSLC